MPYLTLKPGDSIISTHNIVNDGSFPQALEDEVLVPEGSRGVIIDQGHLQDDESKIVYLVKFETIEDKAVLGPPIGCWPEDIRLIPEESL